MRVRVMKSHVLARSRARVRLARALAGARGHVETEAVHETPGAPRSPRATL